MSGYTGQEETGISRYFNTEATRILSPEELSQLQKQAKQQPHGVIASFLLSAVERGWSIDYPKVGSLIAGYDEIVGRAWIDGESEHPVDQACAQLALVSIDPHLHFRDNGK